MRIKAKVSVLDILGHALIWLLLSFLTLGIALMFWPYSFAKFVINRCTVEIDGELKDFECKIDMFGSLGHNLLWLLITFLTFGIGYVFYVYKVWAYALNKTRIH